MKALIKVGDRCNQACRFCHRGAPGAVDRPRGDVDRLIDRAAALGHDMVVLSGGEATLRPELLSWAHRAAALGLDFGLVTNGTLLDAALFDSLIRLRMRYAHLSLHGGTAEVHDDLVRARGFHRVRDALRALDGRGLDLWANCVVVRPNLERLRAVVDAVAQFRDVGLKFSFVEPRGSAGIEFDALVPTVTEGADRVLDALGYARETLGDHRKLAHDGFPLCLLPGWEAARGDLRSHGFATMAELGEGDLHAVDELNTVRPERCRPCASRGRCPGLFRDYLARRGDGEVRPTCGRPLSNSFNYVYEGHLSTNAEACPVEAIGVAPWHPARHLFVRNGNRVGRFQADTRDFSDDDIAEVKRQTGQVYFDASRGDAPDDFERQLVKLQPSAACGGCPRAPACPGIFEPAAENVFARDDARVLRVLASLEGDVLDVGCGEGPYGDALAKAARDGRLRYVGLEPDADRAARLRARWPWASVAVGTAEDFPLLESSFDHVLVLRSWNHLSHPAPAATRLGAALRPGGTITVVDNVAFGLARTRGHSRRAERSPARFEHFRNDGAAEAHAVLGVAAPALRLIERFDVGPQTSNQWLLRYAKRC
jgi:MoaA/NifB/PqqE/SkfB family radical SAM enzyme/SAM-dependent methyltransferase